MSEQVLVGGHMNDVVRIGDTVRRSAGEWTPTIHRLLRHARERGATWVPEPHGHDELGREVLSFIPGDVPHQMPAWAWTELVLCDVARALRQWHDATTSFDTSGARWNFDAHEPREVICHNDFAPYNCVFRDGRFAGAIDFDLCSPGPRLWDIAYTAYRFVPLMPPVTADVADGAQERSPFTVAEGSARLAVFLGAYAEGDLARAYDEHAVLDATRARLLAIADWTANYVAETGNAALAGNAEMYRAHARWLAEHLRHRLGSRSAEGAS